MVVGIDCRATVAEAAGRGRLVDELIASFAENRELTSQHEFRLYVRDGSPPEWPADNFKWCPIESRGPLWHVSAARDANRHCDVFLSTNSYLTPLFLKIPTVTFVYDMIPFKREFSPRLRSLVIERLLLRLAIGKSSRLIAISRSTASDLASLFPNAASKAEVVPLAANNRFSEDITDEQIDEVRRRYGLERSYMLVVGTLEPRKNLPRLIDAYLGLGDELQEEYGLAIAGLQGWNTNEIDERISDAEGRVTFLGYVPDADLAALYRGCALFCYPSLYEGFGLPVLEAMKAGAPVVTSNTSSMPEVGGEAPLYIDPQQVADIREALDSLLKDDEKRASMARIGIERAKEFSWDKVTNEVLRICQEVGGR